MNTISNGRTGTTRSSFASATGGFVATSSRAPDPKKPSVGARPDARGHEPGVRR